MRIRYFGDSYDVVKRSLLSWLAPGEAWAVLPMFTEAVAESDAAAFSRFLGAPLLTTQALDSTSDRTSYLSCATRAGHLFLDPNTGLRVRAGQKPRDPDYVYFDELVALIQARPSFLTVVFDKSVPRGGEQQAISRKLQQFSGSGIAGFAYVSHACFVVLSGLSHVVEHARKELLERSCLPPSRIVDGPAVQS